MRWLAAGALLFAAACGVDTSPDASANIKEETRVFRARLEIPKIVEQLEQYQLRHGAWPEEWADVGRAPLDPWRKPYVFEIDGDDVIVYSLGPDGEPGTGDEVR